MCNYSGIAWRVALVQGMKMGQRRAPTQQSQDTARHCIAGAAFFGWVRSVIERLPLPRVRITREFEFG